MHIHDITTRTGLSARQIRAYEKIGLLGSIARTPSGYRVYQPAQLHRLHFIKHARDVGFSLAQTKALLTLQDDEARSNVMVKELTQNHIVALTQKIERLQAMKLTLQTWHDNCLGDGSAQCSILEGLMTGQTAKDSLPCTHDS